MQRRLFLIWAVLVCCLFCPAAAGTSSGAAPSTQPTASAPADPISLRSAGIEKALSGDFRAALKLLSEAAELAPDDEATAAAKALLLDYLKHLEDTEAQRAAEYEEAVNRVKSYLLAEERFPKLASEAQQKLRDRVEKLVAAYNRASEKARSAQTAMEDAFQLRSRAAANLQKAAQLRKQANSLGEKLSAFVETTRCAPVLCLTNFGPVRYGEILLAVEGPVTQRTQEQIKSSEARIANLEKEAKDALAKADALAEDASSAKAESLTELDKAARHLEEAREVLKGDAGDYAAQFEALSSAALRLLAEFRGRWERFKADNADEMRLKADALKTLEEDLAGALVDVDVLVDEKPWRAALGQAGLAAHLASEADKPKQQGWYRSLVAVAKAHGDSAVADARWYDALDAYGGLSNLEEDNEDYKQKAKTIRKHVRVLGLYGRDNSGEEPGDKGVETYRDYVHGVDDEMAKTAISKLSSSYVTTVDYRKIARAALDSLRILAETPQAVHSFKGLADEESKRRFLDAIADQLESVEKRDRVDHLDLVLALLAMLNASERTVHIPRDVIAYEFTEGMLGDLDTFSSVIWPHDVADFRKHTMGHFYGVGIQITKEDGRPLKVITPLADSPALKAGIRAGDMIIAVDGSPTKKAKIDSLIKKIMGPKDTKVVLTVARPGRPAPIDFEVIRDRISIRTVKGWRRETGGKWQYLLDPEGAVAYIQLTQFTDKTPSEIVEALAKIKEELAQHGKGRPRSLVLDLRFNPGGLLKSAAKVANEFLQAGVIVVTRGLNKPSESLHSDRSGKYLGGDLIVLVNEQSASAAEIVSGAVKDRNRGLIVGGRTYGKGSVQNVIPIRPDRAYLKLTTAYYYLPSGRLLHRRNGQDEWGVDPHIQVKFTPKQTRRWLEIRRRTGLLLTDELPKTLDQDLKKQYENDIQLQTAVLLLKLLRLQDARAAA